MTITSRIKIALLALLAAGGVTFGAGWLGYAAYADSPDYVVHDVEPLTFSDGHARELVTLTADGRTIVAQADTGGAAPAAPAAPSPELAAPAPGEATGSGSEATPADKLHDPLSSPGASWDDLKAAKKVGWPLAVFAGLIMLCKLLARAKSVSVLAALGKGKTAVVVAAVGAIATACFNAATDGGAWSATAFAGLLALAHYFDATPKDKEPAGS